MTKPSAGRSIAWKVAAVLSALFVSSLDCRAQVPVGPRGALMVVVTDKASGQPLPFADVKAENSRNAAFANELGQVLLVNLPAGNTGVRARRLGFQPLTVNARISAGRMDTVRVALTALSLQLGQIRVSDSLCPNRVEKTGDTAVVAILQQVQMNAERLRQLAEDFPFTSSMERIISNEAPYGDRPMIGQRRTRIDTIRVDTVDIASNPEWRYAPGRLIVPHNDRELGVRQKLMIPQLADFADTAFVAAHCFRFAGLDLTDSTRAMRVDFEPTKAIRGPDVRGSLWLDTLSYQIIRSTLFTEQQSPLKASDLWDIRVDTWFRQIRPALPVIDRVSERTTLHPTDAGQGAEVKASMEYQRLIGFVFNGGRP